MSDKDRELDDFWDLSSLIPNKSNKSKPISGAKKSTSCEEISFTHSTSSNQAGNNDSSTVIKRYIDPLYSKNKRIKRESFLSTESYSPDGALIHKVTLKKKRCQYELYERFFNDAIKYSEALGEESDYVPFFSYVPQYDQLSAEQLSYYLWWRDCFKVDIYIKTDLSYVLLYIFELINAGGFSSPLESQKLLAKLWNVYSTEFSSISGKLAVWICDFSLLHKLPPPSNINRHIAVSAPSLKEFFIHIPSGDFEACARSLLKYGTEYDYRTSKFAKGENSLVFEKHILGAMSAAAKFFSPNGKMLSALASEDSKIIRNSFDGAVCSTKWKYEIEVEFCSFSRSNEVRFIMGDVVKYSENKIRAFLGVKSRLSVYSIGNELQRALDEYFATAFEKEQAPSKKVVEHHEYDALHETPLKPLSLENAKRIENESWATTYDLVSAFEQQEIILNEPEEKAAPVIVESKAEAKAESLSELAASLGEYLDFALAVKNKDFEKMNAIAKALGKLPDAVVDIINEISSDVISDILIEHNGLEFEVIDCYIDLI